MTTQYVAGMEGFDIYSSGALAASFPWFITNTSLNAQINTSAGAFGGGAITLPTSGAPSSLTSGTEYQFLSTMQMIRGNTAAGGQGCFAISGWLNVNTMTAGSGTLLGIGSSLNTGVAYPILNISQSSTTGLNLQFITNLNSPTSNPYNFNIQLNTYYWITMSFAYYSTSTTASTGTVYTTVTVNGATVLQDQPVTWSADIFTTGQVLNRLKFYGSSFLSYFMDDLMVQAVSSADAIWPVAGGSYPTAETVPNISARRIYAISATGNGSVTQWSPSGSEPNWQSATDPTGANYVTATATGQTDTYKWNCPTTSDVRVVAMRGNSNRYQNIVGTFKTSSSSGQTNMTTNNGPSRYISFAETDGTNPWTTTSINAGEFGQTSR
jgi:hypothetical protein